MIRELDNSSEKVAEQIFSIFQNSYKVEARLIGTDNFPPLSRSTKDIGNSQTQFFGFFENEYLAAIIEVALNDGRLEINSLTVDPSHFRKGIASKMLDHVLETFDFSEAIVETATVNIPAITLYEKHGFIEFKRWVPSHGIPKVAMQIESAL